MSDTYRVPQPLFCSWLTRLGIVSDPWVDFAYISVDLLHCLDLGVVQYLCGCALYDLFLELGGSESAPSEVLQYLLVLIKQAGKALAFASSKQTQHEHDPHEWSAKDEDGGVGRSQTSGFPQVCVPAHGAAKTPITVHFVFIASSSLPKPTRRCQRGAPTQAFALLSWDVKRWSFMENCRWKTCKAWCGNVGDGCCTSCTPRCTKCTAWRSKWLRLTVNLAVRTR